MSDGGAAGLRSGQVAAAAGVNPQTLRYYERRGLLDRPVRTPGGHRVYPQETVTLLRVIKTAQRLGFTLDEVAALLEPGTRHRRPGRGSGPGGRDGTRADLAGSARAKLAEVEARIEDLAAVAATLRSALAAGCDDLVACSAEPACPLPFPAP
ncbi:MerR family transcriptional regulator [Actinomadura sp. 7K534]|uniref:MerR family transcriptional regulator n=1 Tax=Actinomadura sp. 7K534 TaxID=2530366 RepID=UPI0010513F3E|nr:MerR family transcriptional regulator [Actinomadura sp. 7K534]TDB95887.1 MerR family transcriptional regulator [Actinomadura sp. 7K534]